MSTTVMSTVFGNNSLLNTAMTGLIRVPALLTQCIAAAMVGELIIRGLSGAVGTIFAPPKQDSLLEKVAVQINDSGIRPYKNQAEWSTQRLALVALAFTVMGIAATETVRFLAGNPAPIYNKVLSFMGCIRIAPESYLDGVNAVLSGYGYGFR